LSGSVAVIQAKLTSLNLTKPGEFCRRAPFARPKAGLMSEIAIYQQQRTVGFG